MPGIGDPIQRALRHRAAHLRGEQVGDSETPGDSSSTRRGFLAAAAVAGAAFAGAGPAGAAFADPRTPTSASNRRGAPRVVVVGAGLAGLSCAYRLHKKGIEAVVYEARKDRVGGRCWTVRGFTNAQVAEHGGEFIDTRHVQIRRIARELGLSLEDSNTVTTPVGTATPIWINGRRRDPAKVYAGFDEVFRRLSRANKRIGSFFAATATRAAREFDEMTAAEWLSDNVDDPLLKDAITIGQSGFFGVDTSRMSAINLIEAFVTPYPGADERYHVRGGNDQIPNALAQALTKGAVRPDTPLLAIRRRRDGSYALRFGGVRHEVLADRVVLCLPFTALRDVDLTDAGLSAKRMRSIAELGMGTNAKNHVQLKVRPHELGNWSGDMVMDGPHPQSSWDSTVSQPGASSIITIWRGGRSGASYPTKVPHQWAPASIVADNLAAFERGVPGITAAYNGLSWLDSWVDDPWTRGSYAGFLPGQYTKYWGYLKRAEGGVHFAGEHTSTYSQGYLNGGVESGERAAREVLAALGATHQ